jgi:hypothetical protein
MRAVAVVALLASPAAATPLEPLWETPAKCERAQVVPWGGSLAWIDRGRVRRIDRATGALAPVLALGKVAAPYSWTYARLEAVLGDTLVVHGGHFFAAVDAATGAVRWTADQGHDAGLPRVLAAGGDVIWVHPSSLDRGDAVELDRLAIATGKSLWHAAMPPDSGQVEWVDSDGARVYVSADPDSTGPVRFLAAFDVATGRRLWSHKVSAKRGVVLHRSGTSIVYTTDDAALRVLDGATGAALPDVPLPEPAITMISHAAQLDVVSPRRTTAIDMATRAVIWTQPRIVALVVATPAAVYAMVDELEMLLALDPRTGGELASWGAAGLGVLHAATDGAAPVIMGCDGGNRLLALDPTGTVRPIKRATITGTLECPSCVGRHRRFFEPTAVEIGRARATTDARGRFKVELAARGALTLGFALPDLHEPISWGGATRTLVRFRGNRTYALGALRVGIDCGPIEPPCQR